MDTTAPPIPTMNAETPLSGGTINIVGSNVVTDAGVSSISSGGILEYEFCYNTTGAAPTNTNPVTECGSGGWSTENSKQFSPLTVGQIYYYFVRSRDALLNTSNWSSSVSSTQDSIAKIVVAEPGLTITKTGTSTDVSTTGTLATADVPVTIELNNIIISEITADLSTDRTWTNVTAAVDVPDGKSVIANLTASPGAAVSHTLYIPIPEGRASTSVVICLEATELSGVDVNCSPRLVFYEGDPAQMGISVSKVTVNGQAYWKAEGVTGTGGVAILGAFILSDLNTRMQVSTGSDHTLSFGTSFGLAVGAGDYFTLTFPSGYDFNGISVSDIDLKVAATDVSLASVITDNNWVVSFPGGAGANVVRFDAPTIGTSFANGSDQLYIEIGTLASYQTAATGAQIKNPTSPGSYRILIDVHNTFAQETGEVSVPIVDSDQVNITSYINTYISFDIDTNTDNSDCNFNGCMLHGGVGAGFGNSYTIDLGELNAAYVNKSSGAAVMHSDNLNGVINSIYIDLTSNAYNGITVLVSSANGWLQGPTSNKLASVTSGENIISNSGKYGYQILPTNVTGNGTINPNTSCTTLTTYCGFSTSPTTAFDTNNKPLGNGRIRIDLAAAATYTNNPGSYTDTLTFIAVANF